MGPRVFRQWSFLLAAGFWIIAVSPGAAASLVLSEREREEALQFGRRSVITEGFGNEWRVQGPAGQSLVVMTPFHRLALAARNTTFKNEPLTPKEIESLLKEHSGKLTFWTTLRGGKPDFARFLAPALLDGRVEIKPTFVQNELTALPEDDGRYAARCVYVFPADRLNPGGRVTLVVRDPSEKEVARFQVDLSAMR
jgi:hypothetical protein